MTALFWLLGGIAALLASGFISGAWESFKKRLFRDFGGALLKLYTLGNKRLEKNLFKYIAMRPKKDASLLLLYLASSSVAVGFSVQALQGLIASKCVPALWLAAFLFFFILIGHCCLKILYCEFYTMRFDFYMALARPYLSDEEHHLYNARFASIESKQQHMELCDEVKLRGKKGKLSSSASAGTRPAAAEAAWV